MWFLAESLTPVTNSGRFRKEKKKTFCTCAWWLRPESNRIFLRDRRNENESLLFLFSRFITQGTYALSPFSIIDLFPSRGGMTTPDTRKPPSENTFLYNQVSLCSSSCGALLSNFFQTMPHLEKNAVAFESITCRIESVGQKGSVMLFTTIPLPLPLARHPGLSTW